VDPPEKEATMDTVTVIRVIAALMAAGLLGLIVVRRKKHA
jgi:LPXTG-motif cell wall-anchored protein